MERIEFQKSLRLGLGRAIIYAQGHDLREFRNLILDACLHCYSYDVQIEGTRASYMYDLVGCLPDKDFYYDAVLKSLPGSGDDVDAVQRFHLAACLAFDGSDESRQAMYESYVPGPDTGEQIGIDFLKLDGIKGLLFVAEKIGALLSGRPDEVDVGWLIDRSLEICGEPETWDALREAGGTNPDVERYRRAAVAMVERWTGEPAQRPDFTLLRYEQLSGELMARKRYLLPKWGERASDEELEKAARGLIAATDPKQQFAHLRIFAQRCFPCDVHTLLDLVGVEQDRVGWAAVKALANVGDPAVRDLAFRLVEGRAKWRGEAIALLARSYEEGDHKIILGWFQEEEDPEALHSMGMELIDFWEAHPDDSTQVSMLRSLYERGPCSFCREGAVNRLLERGALPDELRAECTWDANDDIRSLVNETGEALPDR